MDDEPTVGSPWRWPRIPVTPLFRGAWRLPGPTSSRAPPPGCPDGRGEASLVPGAGVLNACAGGSVRTGPGPALAQPVSQHVTGVGLGIAHGHQGCGNFPLGEDHPIEKITRYPIPGGALCRYNVVALHSGLCMPWWLGMLDTPGWPKSAT